MFGLIIAGRQVQATPAAITETQYAFQIPPAPSFSHIVVFLLPGTELPAGTAASVFVQLPPLQDFKFLGGIGPGKESAIFKVSGLKSGCGPDDLAGDAMNDDVSPVNSNGANIVVGISIEPAAQVESQMASLRGPQSSNASSMALTRQAPPASSVTTKVLAQRIIGNAFNFLASFGSDTVPLKAFQDWWTKFEKRVDLDPSFLEREQQG